MAQLERAFPGVAFPVCPTAADLHAVIGAADALIGGGLVTRDTVRRAARLRWIQATSAGVNHLPIPEISERQIVLTNFSGVLADPIAEHIVSLMLAFARGLRALFALQDRHRWRADDGSRPATFELTGQTIGIVGLGEIGEALARRAHGLGMRVLATRRRPARMPTYVDQLLPSTGLPELLKAADHVVLCLPLTQETRGVIGAAELALMRRSAYLYNVGRGGLIEQEALITALRTGQIAGAGLDVTEPEPLPATSPLWDLPNVLLTMHSSGATPRPWDRGIALVSENVAHFLAGTALRNVVDVAAGY